MRVKFRGKTLNIKNNSKKRNEFCANWNHYDIEVFENDYRNVGDHGEYWKAHRFYVCATEPMGSTIVDGSEAPTQTKCLQIAFDNIDFDLKEKEEVVNQKTQYDDSDWVDEIEYWLKEMSY
ncbi:hypothetical protein DS742_14345 [Lacrimispora amygdalina]|uniref:Uncharacterized protein n=1 Tax=Lacrimispora amygdalina TaxID=253257 RepID=A0A3E2NB94_9FIRM|nr:hypothetical protein [Clostridium indicum]RFZ78289.1 hypothetical protein DS742_14345 [Clostridium indicum]